MTMPGRVEFPTYETLLTEAIRSLAVDSGTVTTPAPVGTNILQDNTKNWPNDVHKNRSVKIIRGSGVGQLAIVDSNTEKSLVLKQGWAVGLDTTSVYVILNTDLMHIDLAKLIPIDKAAIFNTALPAADTDILGAAITPTNSPSYLRIYACVSVAGVLRVARTVGAVTITEDLNSGNNLVAGAAYMFTIPWRTGDSVNVRYSVTAGTIKRLLIDEIGGAE